MHLWLIEQRKRCRGFGQIKAIDESLDKLQALTRYIGPNGDIREAGNLYFRAVLDLVQGHGPNSEVRNYAPQLFREAIISGNARSAHVGRRAVARLLRRGLQVPGLSCFAVPVQKPPQSAKFPVRD